MPDASPKDAPRPGDAASDVPVIETARCLLRGHTRRDFNDSAAMWGDERVTRHIGGRPFTHEEVWTRLLRYVGHWPLMGFGYWVATEKDTGRFIGEVGFADYHRAMVPSLDVPEAGWVLAPWAHGKGYATEIVSAMLVWADDHLGSAGTACIIEPSHVASIRVAQKLGYQPAGEAAYGTRTMLVMRRPGSDKPTE